MMHPIDITGKAIGIKPDADAQEDEALSHHPSATTNAQAQQAQNHGASGAPAAATAGVPRVRRRNRMITSCLECRRRKLKCDKQHPCTNCTKSSRDCLFLAPALDSASQLKLTEIKEKMGSLERVLEQDVAKKGTKTSVRRAAQDADAEGEDIDFAPEPEDEKYLEPSALTVQDAVYDEDAVDDDIADLGFAMGKMRLTDRIGGFFRPKMGEELTVTLNDSRNDHRSQAEKQRSPDPPMPYIPGAAGFLAPGPTYIAPSSSFFLSNGGAAASLIDFLPSKVVADRLLAQYWKAVHPIARAVHRGSFQKRYDAFWDDVTMGVEPPNSLQAVIFAAMFSGVVSMPDNTILMEFGVAKKGLVENFQMGTETALGRANFIRTAKVETLQAFIMYMIPLCRGEVSRSHSALVGTAIRIAECMGLHRDGTEYGLGSIETHVRRILWYQLCLLDIRTCEAQGPRPGIRADEFDTQLPLNIDDAELEEPNSPTRSASRWTDMTLSLIRMECNEIIRVVWVDRPRLEKKKISLTAVLGKVENFRRMMQEKYMSFIDERVPIQRAGRLIFEIQSLRMHAMILHRYHNSVSYSIPGEHLPANSITVSDITDRLRQIIITSGVTVMESAIELETSPSLSIWAWFAGAIQQYHYALLILIEIYAFPMRKEADRIWACLDYIYDVPPGMTREQKGRWIITQIRDKTNAYMGARKARAPARIDSFAPRGLQSSSPGSQTTNSHSPMSATSQSVGKMQPISPHSTEVAPQVAGGHYSYVSQAGNPAMAPTSAPLQRPQQPNFMQLPNVSTSASMPAPPMPPPDAPMVDIDWYEWDKLFPPDVNTGELNLPNASGG